MSLDAHQRETELFGRALDLAVGEQRAFLERECAGDATLAARVLRLLARDRENGTRFDRPAHEELTPRPVSGRLPERVGPYRILGLLGQGGMGLVYRAEQESPRREVALKVIRSSAPSLELVRRFEKEAHVLARLDHQGIARIFDAGMVEGPRGPEPFVTMELVEGEPLLAYAERHGLARAERIELLARVCDAVAHAHGRGVVHRDLKPSNVLVRDDGQPKVLDFGVALIVRGELEPGTQQTAAGELLGTLPYMSPEQLAGKPEAVDARADVYALGVMAYELLTGRRPHALEGLSVLAAARQVSERAPPRLGSLDRTLRGDVETIVSKALERDPEQRYATVRELADDLRRYLRHEPVTAVAPSGFYYLRRFARRNPALTTSLALAALALVAGTAISTWQARRAEEALARAEGLRTLADEQSEKAHSAATSAALAAARVAADHHDVTACRRLLESIEPAERGWVWRWLARRADERIARFATGEPLLGAAFVPDSAELVAVDAAGMLTRWVLGESEARARLALGVRLTGPAAFDREGAFVAGVHGAKLETVSLWEAASGRLVAEVSSAGVPPEVLAVASGGRWVAYGGPRSFLWDTSAREPVAIYPARATGLAFSDDGSRLGCSYNSVRNGPGWFGEIDVPSAKAVAPAWPLAKIDALGVAMGSERRAAVAFRNKRAYLIDLERRVTVAELSGERGPVQAVCFDPAGERVASGSAYGTVRVCAAADGHELAVLSGASEGVCQLAFSADGSKVLALSRNELSLWDVSAEPDVLRGHASFVYDLAFVRGGARLVSLSYAGELCVWDAASSERLHRLRLPGTTFALATARDGELLALGQPTGISILEGDSLQPLRSIELGDSVREVSLSPDGALVAGRSETQVVLWDVASGARRGRWSLGSGTPFPALAFAHDGRRFAAAHLGDVIVWDASSGVELARLRGHGGPVEALAFSLDDALLASGSMDRTVRLWDARSWQPRAVLEGHTDRVYALAFSPDGALLASGSNDTTIRLWSVPAGEELALLTGHEDYVFALEFDPDGTRLASASGDTTLRLWDTLPRGERWRAGELVRARRDAARPRMAERLGAAGELGAALRGLGPELAGEEREACAQALLQLAGDSQR